MLDFPTFDALKKSKRKSVKNQFTSHVLQDLWTCLVSREASLLGRKEVLGGKAKFGILGDGKEVPQVALARFFKKGDFRSGYYRDQTIMFSLGVSNLEEFFAQLYADSENDPFSGGRQMNNHFATPFIDEDDNFVDLTDSYNITSDISPTGGQMGRALGLALASNKFDRIKALGKLKGLSNKGKEVVHVTIGDASTSEGIFWESINAATVVGIPMIVSVWDDGYGISVPKEKQTAKGSISKALEGFLVDETGDGLLIYTVKGWDYPSLINVYDRVTAKVRKEKRPALIHVQELTQPQGHSTSGSHERYKSQDRLAWEKEYDCIEKMIEWVLDSKIADKGLIEEMRVKAVEFAKDAKNNAWKKFSGRVKLKQTEMLACYAEIGVGHSDVDQLKNELSNAFNPSSSEIIDNGRKLKNVLRLNGLAIPISLENIINNAFAAANDTYHTKLYSSSDQSALNIPVVHAEFSDQSPMVNGFEILNQLFDKIFEEDPRLVAFGEDVGKIGGVNQGFADLQKKFGEERIFDAGIREWSIMGAAIGLAMRGLRPIAEIQYLDYLIYGMSPLSDDMATLRYRSNGLQMAPAIIRTRGHRLEGIWHAGSPLGMLINSLRGMYICVPRNMVQAAGMYNTLRKSTDPALVIEVLNGYRMKEQLPDNIAEFTIPLGSPEILTAGSDVTVVTYGVCARLAVAAAETLASLDIEIEVIDVQTLLPFDLEHGILESLEKTNKVLFLDEDFPGGATAFMMQEVLEKQNGYVHLDAAPKTLTASDHRTPFGSDGDYYTKPQTQDIIDAIIKMMKDYDPELYGHL